MSWSRSDHLLVYACRDVCGALDNGHCSTNTTSQKPKADPWPYEIQDNFIGHFWGKKVHLISHQIQ